MRHYAPWDPETARKIIVEKKAMPRELLPIADLSRWSRKIAPAEAAE
jgi:hypothetical protein